MTAASNPAAATSDIVKQQQAALMLRQLLLQQQGAQQQVSKKSRELYVGRARFSAERAGWYDQRSAVAAALARAAVESNPRVFGCFLAIAVDRFLNGQHDTNAGLP